MEGKKSRKKVVITPKVVDNDVDMADGTQFNKQPILSMDINAKDPTPQPKLSHINVNKELPYADPSTSIEGCSGAGLTNITGYNGLQDDVSHTDNTGDASLVYSTNSASGGPEEPDTQVLPLVLFNSLQQKIIFLAM
jgi:hypothetical protein